MRIVDCPKWTLNLKPCSYVKVGLFSRTTLFYFGFWLMFTFLVCMRPFPKLQSSTIGNVDGWQCLLRLFQRTVVRASRSDALPTCLVWLGHCIFQSRVPGALFAVVFVHECECGKRLSARYHLRHVRFHRGTTGTLPVIVATLGGPLSVSLGCFLSPAGEIPANLRTSRTRGISTDRRKCRCLCGPGQTVPLSVSRLPLVAVRFYLYRRYNVRPDVSWLGGYFLAPPFPPRYNKTQQTNIAIAAAVRFRGLGREVISWIEVYLYLLSLGSDWS